MYYSMSGSSVLHYLLEFAQTHVHWVSDAIQPSHPLSSLPPPALNLSQHQGLFQWVGSLHQAAKVLAHKHQSFQWIFRVNFLQDWLVWSPCRPRIKTCKYINTVRRGEKVTGGGRGNKSMCEGTKVWRNTAIQEAMQIGCAEEGKRTNMGRWQSPCPEGLSALHSGVCISSTLYLRVEPMEDLKQGSDISRLNF